MSTVLGKPLCALGRKRRSPTSDTRARIGCAALTALQLMGKMEALLDISLLTKAAVSVAAVLGLTFVAEHASTRIAGLMTGAPVGVVLVYVFFGYDMGTEFAVESVPYGVASFAATLLFVTAYFGASARLTWSGPIVTGLISSGVFIGAASVLAEITFSLLGGLAFTAGFAFAAWLFFRRIEIVAVTRPVRITAPLLVLRGGSAALLIVGVTTLAQVLGPRWAGLLAGFPVTLLPTLLIIHITYGAASTHSLIRNFPLGVGSVVLYVFSLAFTFPTLGVIAGSLASLVVSSVYLVAIVRWSGTARPADANVDHRRPPR